MLLSLLAPFSKLGINASCVRNKSDSVVLSIFSRLIGAFQRCRRTDDDGEVRFLVC